MKQVILVREDLKLPRGKTAAQVSHASLEAAMKSSKNKLEKWKSEGSKKVILSVKDKEELFKYKDKAKKLNLKIALIKDAGRTFLKESDYTCLGIGPDEESKIDKVSRDLKLLK